MKWKPPWHVVLARTRLSNPRVAPNLGITSPIMQPMQWTPQIAQPTRDLAAAGQSATTAEIRWAAAIPVPATTTSLPAQIPAAIVPVPSALAETHTTSPNATPPSSGTGTPHHLPEKVTKERNSELPPPATPCVSTETCPKHAIPTPTNPGTGAQDAVTMITEPSPAALPNRSFQ